MKSKAWMEAQREVSQNQNLIYKADSVLEYSCFDKFLGSVSNVIHNQRYLFSESTRWGTFPPTNMLTALNRLVTTSLNTYVTSNFSHGALGGRASAGEDYAFNGGGAAYSCQEMARVWELAKCTDFISRPNQDDFFMLSRYNSNWDPRGLPTNSGAACSADTTRWAENMRRAYNEDEEYRVEEFQMYESFFNTSSCNPSGGVGPIPTGIIVTRPGIPAYKEHICVNPGCAFNRSGACVPVAPR